MEDIVDYGYLGSEKDEDEKKHTAFPNSPSTYMQIFVIADCNMQNDGALIAVGFSIDSHDKSLKIEFMRSSQ